MRSAYRLLFAEEGTFQERIDDTASTFGKSQPVMEIIDFIRADDGDRLTVQQRGIAEQFTATMEDELDRIESAVDRGETDLRALGFWKVVAAVRPDASDLPG